MTRHYSATCAHKSLFFIFEQHLGEKYIFRNNEDQIKNDEKILEHLKENYGGDLILIPGDTNAGKLNENAKTFLVNLCHTFLQTSFFPETKRVLG